MNFIKAKGVPFALTAIEAVKDAKKTLGGKISVAFKGRLAKFDNELKEIGQRLGSLEQELIALKSAVSTRHVEKVPAVKKAGVVAAEAPAGGHVCTVAGCKGKHMALGLCKNHYYQFKRGSLVKTENGFEKVGKKKKGKK